MNALTILRHSLTEANERRLYCGWTDLPLSPAGVALCEALRAERPLPEFEITVTSALLRTDETLLRLTSRAPDITLPDLREMHFGTFEMFSYDQLKSDADYQRWITDDTGAFPCPGGECRNTFQRRVARGAQTLAALPAKSALAILHGGVIVQLMQRWFPDEPRNFYDWQSAPCHGYHITFQNGAPQSFKPL